MEVDGDEREPDPKNRKKVVIKIPSYQEVVESSQSKSTPPSLFAPSQSFSQAFSFLKSSEFYSPPPPPPPETPQVTQPTVSRENRHSNVPSSSSTVPTSSVASSQQPQSSPSPAQNRNAILVSHRQKGNPLLKHIRNVKWAFADVVCDYLLGQSSCALYLSLRYHLLHPDYLYFRIRELQKNFKLRIVLCHVDVEDVLKPLLEVTKTALLHDCTLLCGWSLEECGRYLETIKVYENKPADIIQGQMDTDYLSRINHSLTAVRHVNKTDVVTLGTTFGVLPALLHHDFKRQGSFLLSRYSFKVGFFVLFILQSLSHIMDASMEDLARCPGIGERKVKRLHDTFHEPFKRVVTPNEQFTNHPAVPETSTQNNVEPSSVNEDRDEKEPGNESKHSKKEPELTVKSALSAAFSKYADKVARNNKKSRGEKKGETSSAMEEETDKENS